MSWGMTSKAEKSTKIASIDEFQINEINVDLRTSGFDNEVLSVDLRKVFYCLKHREPSINHWRFSSI